MKKEENNYYNNDNNADYPEEKKFKVNYWLILQDLTYNMTSPCIADLKIGTRTFEINIPKSKQEKRYKSSIGTTTLTHGVRCIDICMRQNNGIVQRWNRKDGRKMSWNDLEKKKKYIINKYTNVTNTLNHMLNNFFLNGMEMILIRFYQKINKCFLKLACCLYIIFK